MTGLNHMLTGTAIALAVKQPALVVPLAFLSHFVLDATPHFGGVPFYQYGHRLFPYAMLADAILAFSAVGAVMVLVPSMAALVALGAFFAILPDILWLGRYVLKWRHWFYTFHQKIQWFERPPGIIVEASYTIFISTVISALIWR